MSAFTAQAAPFSGRGDAPGMSIKSINSAELFDGHREIIILHAGEQYRLRITGNNKLILTK